ncbi:MAG: PD40 domain-containing protein [Anaerolineae bacterium]|nr:PD40 domain-containing protein [Anaerolineae bacterium]
MLTFNLRLLTVNLILFVVLVASAVGLGRLLPGGARITFVQTRGDDSEIIALDIDHALAANLTRSPGRDFSASWSPDGRRMAFVSLRDGQLQLYLLTLGEGVRLLSDRAALSNHPVWSPDGESIVYEVGRGNIRHLWIVDVDQPLIPDQNPRALAVSQTDDRLPAWSPDGARIAFVSLREGNAEIYTIAPDGGDLVNLTRNPGWDVNPAWSPDGSQIAFFALRDRYRELYVMDRDGGNVRQLTNAQEVNNGNYWGAPAWSPDGTRIAYQTVLDGSPQIVVTTVEGGQDYRLTGAQKVNALPLWLPDDRGIVYMSGRGMASALYLVDVDGGSPRRLTPADAISQYPVLWSIGE